MTEGSPHRRHWPVTNPKPPRSRWTIAFVVVVLFAAVGWFVAWPAYQRHRTIQEIERVGGTVARHTVGPNWLQKLGVGFDRVERVELEGTEITDDVLQDICRLTSLRQLSLDAEINDEGWRHLSGLTKLHSLTLSGTQISDNGLKHLSSLTSLRQLTLRAEISDEGLRHLSGLTNLNQLFLRGPKFTDDGLKHLSSLTSLHQLWLHHALVTDDGLQHLSGLTSLRELHLRGTQVTNDGLKHLSNLTSLQRLRLDNTGISDEGLKHRSEEHTSELQSRRNLVCRLLLEKKKR